MPLPLDRPAREVECGKCHSKVSLPEQVWRFAFERFEGDSPPAAGGTDTVTETVAGFRLHLQVARIAPHCEKCGSALPVEAALANGGGDFSCTSCGDPASVWTAPSWLSSIIPTCKQLISTDPGGGSTPEGVALDAAVSEAIAPVAMPCPQCSGSLRITTEHERIVPCQYCSTDVFLPDEVWRRLHPVKTVQWFYAAFEGKTALQRKRAADAADVERIKAERAARAEVAWRSMPSAWAAVVVFGLWQMAMPMLVVKRADLTGIAGTTDNAVLMIIGVTVFLYVLTLVFAARPLAIASGGSVRNHAIGYAILGLLFAPPIAGAIFALFVLILAAKTKNPDDPASGIGKPIAATYILVAVLPQFLFAFFVIFGD
jgi:hypothetical protein